MGKYTKACVQPLWVPPDRGLFPVALGLYIFALVNLSHGYNLLLSLVSSFSKSAKLRGGWVCFFKKSRKIFLLKKMKQLDPKPVGQDLQLSFTVLSLSTKRL